MTTARSGHTATLLADGRVLIAGGNGSGSGNNPLANAELYDPSTGSFTATSDMFEAQFWHNATLLPNGKVLIARGLAVGPAPGKEIIAAAAELYDPLSGTFAKTGAYANTGTTCDFCVATAPLLPDGTVIVIGEWEAQPLSRKTPNPQ
jgi:hypothetical protein